MPFSQEVRFKIGGDTTSLERSFAKAPQIAEAAGRKIEQALARGRRSATGGNGGTLGSAQQRQLDAEYAQAVRRTKAERDLSDFRKRNAYQEADTVGRIKIVTGDLARLARDRSKFEEGSVQWMKIQLQMEEKMAALRELRGEKWHERQTEMQRAGTQGTAVSGGLLTGPNILRGIGAAIAGALGSLLGLQLMRNRNAQAQEESSAAGLSSLRQRFATIGGLQGQLTQGRATAKDLEVQKGFNQQRMDFLVGGADAIKGPTQPGQMEMAELRKFIGTYTGTGREEVEKTFNEIQRINAEIQKQHDTNALIQRELERELMTYDSQKEALETVGRLQSKGLASTVKQLEVERARLQTQRYIESVRGTPEAKRQVDVELERNRNELAAARQSTRARALEVRQTITGQVAQGRTDPVTGRREPRSEAERLAQRAEDYRRRADALAVTQARGTHYASGENAAPLSPWDRRYGGEIARQQGRRPGRLGGVGYYLEGARRDEREVGGRMAQGTAGAPAIPGGDATAIKAEISTSNQLLAAIKNALTESDVGSVSTSGGGNY